MNYDLDAYGHAYVHHVLPLYMPGNRIKPRSRTVLQPRFEYRGITYNIFDEKGNRIKYDRKKMMQDSIKN